MLETPKALGTIIFISLLLVKILSDVTMDNQQGTKGYLCILVGRPSETTRESQKVRYSPFGWETTRANRL